MRASRRGRRVDFPADRRKSERDTPLHPRIVIPSPSYRAVGLSVPICLAFRETHCRRDAKFCVSTTSRHRHLCHAECQKHFHFYPSRTPAPLRRLRLSEPPPQTFSPIIVSRGKGQNTQWRLRRDNSSWRNPLLSASYFPKTQPE